MMERKGVLMGRYEVGRLLGQGTFAKVHHARNLNTGTSVAIKIIDKQKVLKAGIAGQIKREISIMRLVKHPNVVELYEVMATKTKIYLVMEYVKGGELFHKIASKGKLNEDAARRYFHHLISAVDYCHSRGVCHRDLKPENLLLDEDGNLKVSDFGLSALTESKHQDGLLHTTCGTPAYVAPDVVSKKGYDGSKADVWSCGVVLFVLLAGYLPFYDSNLMEMYRKIGKGEYKNPSWFRQDVTRLLSGILDPNPSTRMSVAEIKECCWFRKGVDEDKVSSPSDKESVCALTNLNAFDIISLSTGFDLSGLFHGVRERKEARFTSNESASTIVSKIEDMARCLRMEVRKREGGLMKMEGKKGVLSIQTEIFQITPDFHVVELKMASGDSLEYQRVFEGNIRPALKDIVWTWQGDD